MIVLLDSSPLGRLANPKPKGEAKECIAWLESLIAGHVRVLVPEISDYEVRRELLRIGSVDAVNRLNALKSQLGFLPLNTSVMLRAAELWANIRNQGLQTANDKALDGDVILAAQALEVHGKVATENVGHLARLVDAHHWRDIKPPEA